MIYELYIGIPSFKKTFSVNVEVNCFYTDDFANAFLVGELKVINYAI